MQRSSCKQNRGRQGQTAHYKKQTNQNDNINAIEHQTGEVIRNEI